MKANSLGQILTGIVLGGLVAAPTWAVDEDAAVQLLRRLNALEQEVSTLRGKNQELQHDLETMQQNQRDGFLQVDERMQKLEPDQKAPSIVQGAGSPRPQGAVVLGSPRTTPPPTTAATPAHQAPQSVSGNNQTDNTPLEPVDEGVMASDGVDLSSSDSYYYYDKTKADSAAIGSDKPPVVNAVSVATPATTQASPAGQVPPTAAPMPAANTEAIGAAGEAAARDAYNEAYKTLLANPAQAVPAFRDFLQRFPGHPLAANAQYWIGEALYSQQDYSRATEEFMKVLKQYKNSSKAPDAALKLGFSFCELKQWDFARRTLQDTVRFFPNTNAAKLAEGRLAELTAQGQ